MANDIEIASYDPKKVNVNINGKIITGFSPDGVINVVRNEDIVTPTTGAKGDVTYNENANERAGDAPPHGLQLQPPLPTLPGGQTEGDSPDHHRCQRRRGGAVCGGALPHY